MLHIHMPIIYTLFVSCSKTNDIVFMRETSQIILQNKFIFHVMYSAVGNYNVSNGNYNVAYSNDQTSRRRYLRIGHVSMVHSRECPYPAVCGLWSPQCEEMSASPFVVVIAVDESPQAAAAVQCESSSPHCVVVLHTAAIQTAMPSQLVPHSPRAQCTKLTPFSFWTHNGSDKSPE